MINLEWTDKDGDDFAKRLVKVRATRDGESVAWTLPRRLLMNSAAATLVVDEMIAELRERCES